jgi:hypothetical protein
MLAVPSHYAGSQQTASIHRKLQVPMWYPYTGRRPSTHPNPTGLTHDPRKNANQSRPCAARPVGRWRTRRHYPVGDAALPTQNRLPASCRSADGAGTRLSVAAAVRVFGHRHATITTWLTRAGAHSAILHDRIFRALHLPHIQLDELRSRLRNRTHTLWLWLALEKLTKIIPVLHHPEGTRRADPGCRPSGSPRAAWAAGEPLPARLHQRRSEPLLLCADGPFRTVGGQPWTASPGVAGGGTDLWASQETLSAAATGWGHVQAAVWDACGAPLGAAQTWPERKAEYHLCRAPQFDTAADGGGAHSPHVVNHAGSAAAPAPSGVVAGILSLRTAA